MCCNNPSWTPKANHAKCLAIACLVFGIIGCLFGSISMMTPWGNPIGLGASIITVISSSLIICCGPKAPGPGTGCRFKAAAILVAIAAIINMVDIGGVVMLLVRAHQGLSSTACEERYCANGNYVNQLCPNGNLSTTTSCSYCTYCISESQCRLESYSISGCGAGQAIGMGLLIPTLVISVAQTGLEIGFSINSFQAASTMEAGTLLQEGKPVVVGQEMTKGPERA